MISVILASPCTQHTTGHTECSVAKQTQTHTPCLHAPGAYLPAALVVLVTGQHVCLAASHVQAWARDANHAQNCCPTGPATKAAVAQQSRVSQKSAAQRATFPAPPTAAITAHPSTYPCMAMMSKRISMHGHDDKHIPMHAVHCAAQEQHIKGVQYPPSHSFSMCDLPPSVKGAAAL